MQQELKLELLKNDIEILSTSKDQYLLFLLRSAENLIKDEGIILKEENDDDSLLQVTYAAYLYRKRASNENAMPRMLRFMLNNRKIKEKAGKENV